MDVQTFFDNAIQAARQKELADSPQLLLGELILKLEAVKNKELPLFIDIGEKRPMGIDSWRGRYAELAIQTESLGSYQTDEVEKAYGTFTCYKHKDIGKENPNAQEWIDVLKESVGKTFTGYKGGDFTMGKNTPVWLAENGDSSFQVDESNYKDVFFVDVQETEERVYLVTKVEED